MTASAAASGLGVVGNLLDGLEVVLENGAFNLLVRDPETLTDQDTFRFGLHVPTVVSDGFFQRFPPPSPSHRAMHLLLGKTSQVVGDVLIGDLGSLRKCLPLCHLGEGG